MKITDCWEQYKAYTEDVTSQSRKLGLVVGAGCWFFKTPDASFPFWILLSLVSLVAFFLLDLLQMISASVLLRCWTRKQEKKLWAEKNTIDGDVEKPWWLDRPSFTFFCLKFGALLASFLFLSIEFLVKLQKG